MAVDMFITPWMDLVISPETMREIGGSFDRRSKTIREFESDMTTIAKYEWQNVSDFNLPLFQETPI